MQKLLKVCEEWESEFGMQWSPNKCTILSRKPQQGPRLELAGQKLEEHLKSKFLGVTVSLRGVENNQTGHRMQAARLRLNQLRTIGFGRTGFGIGLGDRLYKTFVRSVMEFAIHLTPLSRKDIGIMNSVEMRAMGYLIKGFKRGHMERLRKITGLPPARERRMHLREKLRARLTAKTEDLRTPTRPLERLIARKDLEELQKQDDGPTDSNPLATLAAKWKEKERKYKNQIPVQRRCGSAPIMKLREKHHLAMATHWHLGHFPKKVDT